MSRMSSTILPPPREQLCNRSCSNKTHTLAIAAKAGVSQTPQISSKRRRGGRGTRVALQSRCRVKRQALRSLACLRIAMEQVIAQALPEQGACVSMNLNLSGT